MVMAFLINAQMVDPKFITNPLNPNSKEKNVLSKGEVSSNMTWDSISKSLAMAMYLTGRRYGTRTAMTVGRPAKPTRRNNLRLQQSTFL